jgi:hypothetical protein
MLIIYAYDLLHMKQSYFRKNFTISDYKKGRETNSSENRKYKTDFPEYYSVY